MWADFEEETSKPYLTVIRDGHDSIDAISSANLLRVPGVYSRGEWWIRKTRDYRGFAEMGLPAWWAYYDDDPDYDTYNVGGFSVPFGEQYGGDVIFGGIRVDLNRFSA